METREESWGTVFTMLGLLILSCVLLFATMWVMV